MNTSTVHSSIAAPKKIGAAGTLAWPQGLIYPGLMLIFIVGSRIIIALRGQTIDGNNLSRDEAAARLSAAPPQSESDWENSQMKEMMTHVRFRQDCLLAESAR